MNLFSYKKLIAFFIALLGMLSTSFSYAITIKGYQDFDNNTVEKVPTGKGYGELAQNPTNKTRSIAAVPKSSSSGFCSNSTSSCGINYRYGAKVITASDKTIYYIYYGNNWGSNDKAILENLALNIGLSPYYAINATYYFKAGSSSTYPKVPVNTSTNFKLVTCSTNGAYLNRTLSDSDIGQIVADSLAGTNGCSNLGSSPNPNALYFVLTDRVTQKSGFGTSYCGWHTAGTTSNGTTIQYSFVGNAETQYPNNCTMNANPNGSIGADGMASVIAHELEEAISDPLLNAWYDSRGAENADKCAWSFGTTTAVPADASNPVGTVTGATKNVRIPDQSGGRYYLIQRNWVNASKSGANGYCGMFQ